VSAPDPVTLGAFVGVLLSGAFVFLEVGRYATPQVPQTLFDERRELFAYTAGLFLGTALAFLFFLLEASTLAGGFVGFVISLVALILVLELGQWFIGRSVYFGHDASLPFYVVGYRAGAGGLLGLLVVAEYLDGPTLTALGLGGVVVEAAALLLLLEAAGIQSTPTGPSDARRPGSLGRGVILEVVGFVLLALGPTGGNVGTLLAGVAVAGGSAGLYLSRRDDVLGRVRAPKRVPPPGETPKPPGRFARHER
jgi:hypothetical protein